jgi:hypothetical protein
MYGAAPAAAAAAAAGTAASAAVGQQHYGTSQELPGQKQQYQQPAAAAAAVPQQQQAQAAYMAPYQQQQQYQQQQVSAAPAAPQQQQQQQQQQAGPQGPSSSSSTGWPTPDPAAAMAYMAQVRAVFLCFHGIHMNVNVSHVTFASFPFVLLTLCFFSESSVSVAVDVKVVLRADATWTYFASVLPGWEASGGCSSVWPWCQSGSLCRGANHHGDPLRCQALTSLHFTSLTWPG